MDTLITQLDQKYQQYKNNLHGDDSLESNNFAFDCAYEYFCITENQPRIKEIIEKDRRVVLKKKQEIIKRNESLEAQKEFMENIERRSLSFCYGEVLKDVYTPLNKYKNALSPLSAKEIIGDASLLKGRFIDIISFVVIWFLKLFGLTTKKDTEARIALIKIVYNFKQKKYLIYMEKIHALLIPQLLKLHMKKQDSAPIQKTITAKAKSNKLEIIFNKDTGILKIGEKEITLSLRNDKNNSQYILEYIFENEEGLPAKSFYSEILESKFPNDKKSWRSVWRACEDINKKVSEQANISNFLKYTTGITGYAQINPQYL